VDAQFEKRACLIYVTATENERDVVREQLAAAGYVVCEVRAELDNELEAKAAQEKLRDEIMACVAEADVCVVLIPQEEDADGEIGVAAGYADHHQKRLIGVVAGDRASYPEVLEDFAPSMVRVGSDRFSEILAGADIWEAPDRTIITDRKIRHVRCQ